MSASFFIKGGVQEHFDLSFYKNKKQNSSKQKDIIWKILTKARCKKSVICCNIEPDEILSGQELSNGLVNGRRVTFKLFLNF